MTPKDTRYPIPNPDFGPAKQVNDRMVEKMWERKDRAGGRDRVKLSEEDKEKAQVFLDHLVNKTGGENKG